MCGDILVARRSRMGTGSLLKEETPMAPRSLRVLTLAALLTLALAGAVAAQDCTGTITADEAMKAELARYAAQTTNDFAAMDKLLGNDLTYNHSAAATD